MAVMLSKTYATLKAAGAPDGIAREAAEEIAGFENRLSSIESDVKLLKWMVGTNIVLTFGILLEDANKSLKGAAPTLDPTRCR